METTKIIQQGWKIVLTLLLLATVNFSSAQSCDSITPFIQADLSAAPNMSWTSPLVARDGNCCGTSAPDKCIEFEILLHPDAISINFEISSGAVPPGALFYQINCGPPIPVGQPICLSGAGPHNLTFCKPGNNSNGFTITSYPEPTPGPDITLNTGCTDFIFGNYYDETTVTWKSVFPEVVGFYNGYLDCLVGCDTVNVTPTTSTPPPFVDFEVCGFDAAGCLVDPVCFTIRVNFIQQLTTQITPDSIHLCFGDPTADVTTITQFGIPPYSYSWSNGATSAMATLGPGQHYVDVMDSSQCIVVSDTIVITQDAFPITADAGMDVFVCASGNLDATLNGSIQTATGGVWSGGLGTFFPSNTDLNAVYTPTPTEVTNGLVQLVLTSTGNNGCPSASDTVQISYHNFTTTIDLTISQVSCFGLADGSANLSVNGIFDPYLISWNGQPADTATSFSQLLAGNYSVQIFNSMGCDTTLFFEVVEPEVVDLSLNIIQHIQCFGDSTGSIDVSTTGGTLPYNYTWIGEPTLTTSSANNLVAGNYDILVQDGNGCLDSISLTVLQPNELTVTLTDTLPACFGNANGSITANANGGVAPYSYAWSNGATDAYINELVSANYSIIVTDDNGCTVQSDVFLAQPAQLIGQITPARITCPNTATALGVAAVGGTGNYSYDWSPGGQTNDTIILFPTASQFYSALITDENNCSVLLTTSVTVTQLNSDDLTATISPSIICAGDSALISANYVGDDWETITLNWLHCSSCATDQPIAVAPTTDSSYIISATNTCGEIIYDTVFISVNPLPLVALAPELGAACPGVEIAFNYLGHSSPDWQYLWNFGDGSQSTAENPSHSYAFSNSYSVTLTVTDENGCSTTTDGNSWVEVFPQAVADFNVGNYDISLLDPTVDLYNYSSNADSYIWDFGDGSLSGAFQPSHTYAAHGNYVISLAVNNAYNCPDTAEIAIEVIPSHSIFVPNAFTPDGDTYNNVFLAQGENISEQGFTLLIYNRWGEVLFESHDMSQGWRGTYGTSDEKVKEGVYIWVIEYRDITDAKYKLEGHVAILK